ncbi:hypothetical protein TrLO_g5990 [Triparma laevis f. longispina]|uniref:Bms1-type G domain-containing protein n=1 Tax=Triparma laevis f. longispina TaxID=1714387 RepID=A0A9W7F297_9STRA|nr:hypothetical protein TrLO_g5990 [Triparma laevis f. longispina]
MSDVTGEVHKGHRKVKAGRGAKEAKKEKKAKEKGTQKARHNPRAFGVANTVRTKRNMQRNLDKTHQKEYAPQTDRRIKFPSKEDQTFTKQTVQLPPPVTVAVHGPPGCGKSTLIRSLTLLHSSHTLTTPIGPITLCTSKTRRVTFLEVPTTTAGQLDCAKVSDLNLLLIDASYGFEMETFEYLNILQTHGLSKCICVLTNLDSLKTAKALRNAKKELKQRFWTEVYQGAKVFCMNGTINNKYLRNDVSSLSLYINRSKFRPLIWRSTHSHIVCDRWEDVTDKNGDSEKETKKIAVYGYVRGTSWRVKDAHLLGVGDFKVQSIEATADPCPFPEKGETIRRKEVNVYAPWSGVGKVKVDRDSVYVEVGKDVYTSGNVEGAGVMVVDLQKKQGKSEGGGLSIFKGAKEVEAADVEDIDEDVEDEDVDDQNDYSSDAENPENEKEELFSEEEMDQNSDSEEEESDDENEDNGNSDSDTPQPTTMAWKDSLASKAASNYLSRHESNKTLQSLIYGTDESSDDDGDSGSDDDSSDDDEFFKIKSKSAEPEPEYDREHEEAKFRNMDTSLPERNTNKTNKSSMWLEEGAVEMLRDKFVTGNWDNADPDKVGGDDDDDSVYDDFEDLETGEKVTVAGDGDGDSDGEDAPMDDEAMREKNAKEKADFKAGFNKSYDDDKKGLKDDANAGQEEEDEYLEAIKREKAERELRNATEFGAESSNYAGYAQGSYVKIVIDGVNPNFVTTFNPSNPLILGGLLPSETELGLIRARVKKHRWHNKILKCQDPLIFSLGWRRFQSIPLLSTEDQNTRHRYLKYTPEHMHCHCTFYGPIVAPNTGFLCVKNLEGKLKGFRVAATGNTLEVDQSFEVVKKLKLVGNAQKIYKNTAYVKGLFNSDLEASKFLGAAVKTVSGIRGQIKKAHEAHGVVRCTFEDKILLSDIVFIRTWMPVNVKEYYNPVTDGGSWQGMKTKGQLMLENNKPIEVNADSIYKPIERQARKFNPLKISKTLEESLPFKSKPKNAKAKKTKSYVSKRAVVMEKDEKSKYTFLQALGTVRNDKVKLRREKNVERMEKKRKEREKDDEGWKEKRGAQKKQKYREAGKALKEKERRSNRGE